MYGVSVYDICRVWQARLSNVTISNVNVLSEMLNIRNGFKTCNILDDDDVNYYYGHYRILKNVQLPFLMGENKDFMYCMYNKSVLTI